MSALTLIGCPDKNVSSRIWTHNLSVIDQSSTTMVTFFKNGTRCESWSRRFLFQKWKYFFWEKIEWFFQLRFVGQDSALTFLAGPRHSTKRDIWFSAQISSDAQKIALLSFLLELQSYYFRQPMTARIWSISLPVGLKLLHNWQSSRFWLQRSVDRFPFIIILCILVYLPIPLEDEIEVKESGNGPFLKTK